jgi:hypothetical protein
MKKLKNTDSLSKTLRLTQETIKLLTETSLEGVRGGQMHTSFSCGKDLCTSH